MRGRTNWLVSQSRAHSPSNRSLSGAIASKRIRRDRPSEARTILAVVARGAAAIAICLIGIMGLIVAWILFIYAGDVAREDEARVSAVIIAIVTFVAAGAGLYLLFRRRRGDRSDSSEQEARPEQAECSLCGRMFSPQYDLRDAGRLGYICNECAKVGPDA